MLGQILLFAAEHADLLELLYEALKGGKVTKASVTAAIRAEMVKAADAEMRAVLGG